MTRRALGTGPTTATTAAVAGERLLPVERLTVPQEVDGTAEDGQQPTGAVQRPARRPLGPRGGGNG